MSAATIDRHPSYDPELRRRALAAYREHRTYKAAGEAMGLSKKRVHELVREALRQEMTEARAGA